MLRSFIWFITPWWDTHTGIHECSCICLSFPFSFTNICESGTEFYWACTAHTELLCASPSLFLSPSLHYGPKQTVWDLNMHLFTTKAFRCRGFVFPVPPYGPLKASWCHFLSSSACFPQKRLQTPGFLCYFCYSLSLTDRARGHCHLLMLNSCLHPLYPPPPFPPCPLSPTDSHFEAFFPDVLCYPDPERHQDRELITNNNNISNRKCPYYVNTARGNKVVFESENIFVELMT